MSNIIVKRIIRQRALNIEFNNIFELKIRISPMAYTHVIKMHKGEKSRCKSKSGNMRRSNRASSGNISLLDRTFLATPITGYIFPSHIP